MSMIFDEDQRVWWPCYVSKPEDGRTKAYTVRVLFELPDMSSINPREGESEIERNDRILEDLIEKIHDWDLQKESGEKWEPTDANIRTVLNFPYMQIGITKGWLEAGTGGARKKT